mmetsp:Transcript_16060/g.38552  ORF Transcript_16060/g.38552 Transcript_16060/m.38552 type:complete len:292 (-) Transcript_16060:451-1326(-)
MQYSSSIAPFVYSTEGWNGEHGTLNLLGALIEFRTIPKGNDSRRIDILVGLIVMVFAVVHVASRSNARHLINLAHPTQDMRVVMSDGLVGAFEMCMIHGIEAVTCREETNVCFGENISGQKLLCLQNGFHSVHALKKCVHGLFVGPLCGGKSSLIDAIVDIWKDPFVQAINFFLTTFGIEGSARCRRKLIKSFVEHAHDFGTFIIHDGVFDLIPKERDGKTKLVIGIRLEVDFLDELRVIDRVFRAARAFFVGREFPSFGSHKPINHRNRNGILQSLQGARDHYAMRPRAS